MERPKKQILFKRPTQPQTGEKKDEPPTSPPIIAEKESHPENGSKLAKWLKQATLINKSALCHQSGVDRANLDKYIAKGYIPEQHIQSLAQILKNYGYAE